MTPLKIIALGLIPACLGVAALMGGKEMRLPNTHVVDAARPRPAEEPPKQVGTIVLQDGSRCHKYLVDYGTSVRTDAGFVPCVNNDVQVRRDEVKSSFRRAFSSH